MGTAVLGNLQEFFSASVTCWIIHQPDGRVRKWDQIYFFLQLQVLITLIGKKDGLRFKGLGQNLRHLVHFSVWPWFSGYISAHYLGPLFFRCWGIPTLNFVEPNSSYSMSPCWLLRYPGFHTHGSISSPGPSDCFITVRGNSQLS